MKAKIAIMFSTTLLLSVSMISVVSAKSVEPVDIGAKVNIEVKGQDNSTSTEVKNINATNTEKEIKATSTKEDNSTTTDNNSEGQLTAEAHRNTVASFVKSLQDVANREGGIGEKVRAIARAQNDSASTTSSAMIKVEKRSHIRTFFLGSDYKNLGTIRSGIATTSNNISQLKALLDKTTSTSDRATLSAQIQVLEAEQAKIEAYVKAHESTFSLFGWFTKLFVK